MNNNVINDYCTMIQIDGPKISIEHLKKSFDMFVSILKEIDNIDIKCALIGQIIPSLDCILCNNKIFSDPDLIKHEFFIILRDNILIEHLHRRNIEGNITQYVLLKVSGLFMTICRNINDTNIIEFRQLLFHKPFIDELTNCLEEIASYGKHLDNNRLLHSINLLLLGLKNFQGKHIQNNEYSQLTPIFFAIIQCLCSSYAINMIKNLEKNFIQKLNDSQILFLGTMPWYLQWYSEYNNPENFINILRILLNEFTLWITSCDPDCYVQCTSKVANMICHLSYFLVRPIEFDNMNILSEEFYHDYCKLVSHWSLILSSTLKYSSKKNYFKLPTRIILQNLYNFTLHENVLNYMKTISNLIPMLLKMTDVEHDQIQLNAYRCLGKIMIETDIKTMAYPSKIASVYIDFIINTIDVPQRKERFYSLLESLKNFVQHDQVKIELIKQNAIPLLITCAIEIRFDPIKVQQIAFEILLALSFNNDTCLILKENENFMNHIKILSNNINSTKTNLQRIAERILWKLEKEEEAITKLANINNSYKYDLMISYSHSDQQICFQIHEQLIKDGFRVWIDRDCLRGSTMIGIANAIENSKYVLICMSNMYKQSVYCQSEAHYAFERGCRLIPIIIESNYKPDGWLGIIVSGKIYVDFIKENFQLAYEKLKNELGEQQYQNLNQSTRKSEEICQINTNIINLKHPELSNELIIDLPKSITEWTHDHVKSFLLQMGLGNTILPLCTRMDGQRLLQFYEMCLMNYESMYQSMKLELNEKHHTLLLISDYLTFLNEIKKYILSTSTSIKPVQSSFISITFCNVL